MRELYRTQKGGIIHPKLKWKNITPHSGNYTFGYYDRNPFSEDNKFHLALKFESQVRLPKPQETAIIGMIDLDSLKFDPIVETKAWCHQQASMQQWIPKQPNHFIFNDFEKDNDYWKLISRVYSIDGSYIRDYDYPIYRLSPDGKVAATLNFSRIPRRGYSYALAPQPKNQPVPDLDNDGLFILDLASGKRNLILSYRTILENHPQIQDFEQGNEIDYSKVFHWMNHACFNSDGTRIMVLHRYESLNRPWKTFMWTMNLDGKNLMCSLPHKYWKNWLITHQLWGRTPKEILVDGNKVQKRFNHQYWVFNETKGADSAISLSPGFGFAGHLLFSPDNKWLMADSYPYRRNQFLNITKIGDKAVHLIGSFFHDSTQRGDMRCDLHPRWNNSGNLISVDSIHYGERKILLLNFEEIKKLYY